MIIYENNVGYKTRSLIDYTSIQSTSVVKKRPLDSLDKLTSENCKFLKTLGLTLKRKSC